MSIIKKAEFATLCGTTRQNINGLVKKGTLVETETGDIDTDHPKNKIYRNKHAERGRNAAAQKGVQDPKYIEDKESEAELKLQMLIKKNRKLDIENEEKLGILIHRDTVAQYVAKIHAIDQTQFYNLGQNLAPEITALCGINDEGKEIEIQAAIEDAVYRVTDNAKRLMDKFLRDLKIEEGGEKL
jgi:hypothetical protein